MERQQLELLYRRLIAVVITLAQILGYPCPIVTRDERRHVWLDKE